MFHRSTVNAAARRSLTCSMNRPFFLLATRPPDNGVTYHHSNFAWDDHCSGLFPFKGIAYPSTFAIRYARLAQCLLQKYLLLQPTQSPNDLMVGRTFLAFFSFGWIAWTFNTTFRPLFKFTFMKWRPDNYPDTGETRNYCVLRPYGWYLNLSAWQAPLILVSGAHRNCHAETRCLVMRADQVGRVGRYEVFSANSLACSAR